MHCSLVIIPVLHAEFDEEDDFNPLAPSPELTRPSPSESGKPASMLGCPKESSGVNVHGPADSSAVSSAISSSGVGGAAALRAHDREVF
eukprot:CAMPEP_0195592996 /NCGR_PEP_ID=MMETSP0815-20121206/653_1 /TAXON_ID=97485 /ORGANISM="Prymnesium parvum, Strain Texoma1" /LENGTH=88 /DNA_ID=CAMNT_0040732115 /DNA_START=937 /DNA_END=1200 /DNA_ORIENTATION=+